MLLYGLKVFILFDFILLFYESIKLIYVSGI